MIKLLRGDDAKHLISLELPEVAFSEGMTVIFEIGGLKVTAPAAPSIEVQFPSTWTALQPCGRLLGSWKIRDRNGNIGTLTKTFPVYLTDDVGEITSGSIVSGNVKPVVDFSDIAELTTSATPGDVKAALNEILRRLKTGLSCILIAFAIPAFSAELTPDTIMDNVPGYATISNVVAAAGVTVGGGGVDDEAVRDIVSGMIESKLDKSDVVTFEIGGTSAEHGKAADANTVQEKMTRLNDYIASNAHALGDIREMSENALGLADDVATLVYGDDCQLVSTNYNSATKMPSLFLRFKIKNETTGEMEWYKVWDELTRWNWLFDDYMPSNYYTKAELDTELDQKADRAWGHYDSHTGAYAPYGYTWVSSPYIAIAGGMSYQRVISSNDIFVLSSNGLVTELGGDASSTNGFFRISDDKGNAIFEITKGTASLMPATADDISVTNIMGVAHLYIPYKVECPEAPKVICCTDLLKKDWKREDEEGFQFNVNWTGESGNWIVEVWAKEPSVRGFVKAEYKQGAKDVIKNIAPVSFTEIVIDGKTYTVKVETISGKKVLVLE